MKWTNGLDVIAKLASIAAAMAVVTAGADAAPLAPGSAAGIKAAQTTSVRRYFYYGGVLGAVVGGVLLAENGGGPKPDRVR